MIKGSGESALIGATIYSCYGEGCETNPGDTVRDIVIMALGQNAMKYATLNCFSGSRCDLQCHNDGCLQMGEYRCYDGAVCNCDGEGCPAVVTMSSVTRDDVPIHVHPLHHDRSDRKKRPGTRVHHESMAFHGVEMREKDTSSISVIWSLNEMTVSMKMLIGTMSVVMILMALFYRVRRSEKGEYEPLE